MVDSARQAVFDRGVAALARAVPDAPEGYGCPICLRVFAQAALEARVLTWEHAPPESIGGQPVCLTCTECNNTSGHELDHHMATAERLTAFAQMRDVELRATLSVGGVQQRGRLGVRNGAFYWEGVPEADPPGVVDRLIEEMDRLVDLGEDAAGSEVKASFDLKLDERRLRIGWMRAAYLVAFAALGYRYVLHPSLDRLRQQIRDPDLDGFIAPIAIDYDAPLDRRMLFLTEGDDDVAGLLVGVGKRRVWLPHIADDGYPARVDKMRFVNVGPRQVDGKFIEWPRRARFLLDLG